MEIKVPKLEDTNYFTVRKIRDENGEIKGEVILYRLKGEEEFTFYMRCPQCGKESTGKKVFKRRPYRIECPHCGYKYAVQKIKPKK